MQSEELFAKYYQTKNISLRNELAEKYLYIAQILAKKFVGRGVEYDDLYQVASLALLKGIERFDPAMGMQFTTFITPTITGEIKNYFRDKSRTIKLPRKLSQLNMEVRRANDELTAKLGHKPTAKEIATALKVSEEEVLQTMEIGGTISLDTAVGDEDNDDGSMYEMIADKSNPFEDFEDKEALQGALKKLSKTEQDLLKLRYADELSQTETANRLGVSQMFVSRMERKVLQRLRELLKEKV